MVTTLKKSASYENSANCRTHPNPVVQKPAPNSDIWWNLFPWGHVKLSQKILKVCKSSCLRGGHSRAITSWQVRFFHGYGYGGYNLVLENKFLHSLKDPQKDEEDTDVLNPGKFDGFPEAGAVGGWTQLSWKLECLNVVQLVLVKNSQTKMVRNNARCMNWSQSVGRHCQE